MGPELALLREVRLSLDIILDNRRHEPAWIRADWSYVHARISAWWTAYKKWEAVDTFEEAFEEKRMTVRTFDAGYANQAQKTFDTIQVTQDNFFADSRYTNFSPDPTENARRQAQYKRTFESATEKQNYRAQRGIDSSAFANPDNFASREAKYNAGLHDLSASLLNPKLSIFDQIHNSEDGAHFSFLPLSEMEDQEVIYKLALLAKDRVSIPGLYEMVRNYRAQMTRLKLAYEMDMAIGYTAVPAPRCGPATSTGQRPPQFKLRYGLKHTTSIVGQKEQPTTPDIYDARRKAAREFKYVVGLREGKNEVVIAIRQHAGPFPLYAVRRGNRLLCYTITPAKLMQRTGYEITKDGRLIRLKEWTPGSPSVDVVTTLDYHDRFEFRRDLQAIVGRMGDIRKREGLHVVVAGPEQNSSFVRISQGVKEAVDDLNKYQGWKLNFHEEVDQKYKGEDVLVHVRHV